MDSIISRHALTCHARHRAMGDVEMMVATVDDEADLHRLALAKSELVIDLDTYRLLTKELRKPNVKIVELPKPTSEAQGSFNFN